MCKYPYALPIMQRRVQRLLSQPYSYDNYRRMYDIAEKAWKHVHEVESNPYTRAIVRNPL